MRRKFVICNWKRYTTAADARRLAKAVVDGVDIEDRVSVAVCPPSPYLALIWEILKGSRVALGASIPRRKGRSPARSARRCSSISTASMLILGHSERRHTLGESDTFINQKVWVTLAAGLDVIFSVCETLDQPEAGQTETVLDRQLIQGLTGLSADTLTRPSIVYEPVWAIGSFGHHANLQQAQEAHAAIRRRFGRMFEEKSAQTLAIQYGGSVKPENAAGRPSRHGVDGALIGVRAGINEPQTEGKPA